MTDKHTPGPWAVWPTADSMIDVAVGPAVGGVAVCQIVTADGRGINTDEAMERGNANARLIASAPDLLDLCERALRALSEDDFPSLRDDLREAIRRATGEQA